MWERFTDGARRVILQAQEEAGGRNSADVGTEHLLLGLTRESEGVAAQVLRQAGADAHAIRAKAQLPTPKRSWFGRSTPPEPKLTAGAKRVLELAADEARRMRHNHIGTEHLLIALARQTNERASQILGEFGLDLEKARSRVLAHLEPTPPFSVLAEPEGAEAQAWQSESDRAVVGVLDQLLSSDNMALKLLIASSLDVEAARERVRKFLDSTE